MTNSNQPLPIPETDIDNPGLDPETEPNTEVPWKTTTMRKTTLRASLTVKKTRLCLEPTRSNSINQSCPIAGIEKNLFDSAGSIIYVERP